MTENTNTIPTHLGFIVDGNRRWARERGLPTLEGHRRGFDKVEMVTDEAFAAGVKYLSFYLFSTENWSRSPEEVDYLMDLVKTNVRRMIKKLKKQNIRTLVFSTSDCPRPDILKTLKEACAETEDCTGGTVCVCFNYGGQQEIADAATKLINERVKSGDTAPVTTADLAAHLYSPEVPPVDMIVRTSGEQRISNFMLWRAAYSEFLFLERNFPDMDKAAVQDILAEYSRRHRRFGK